MHILILFFFTSLFAGEAPLEVIQAQKTIQQQPVTNKELAAAYLTLAQHTSEENHLKKIEYLSKALLFQHQKSTVNALSAAISKGSDPHLESVMGDIKQEASYLKGLISSDKQVRINRLYREQLIYEFGRASSNDPLMAPCIPSMLMVKKERLGLMLPSEEEPVHIHVALEFDNNYAPHAAVVMAMALYHAKQNTRYHFHIVEHPDFPLHSDYQQKIEELKYIMPFDIEYKKFPLELYSKEAWESIRGRSRAGDFGDFVFLKLFLADLFPDLDRILHIDADCLIHEDLQELWDFKFGGTLLAGRTLNEDKENMTYFVDFEEYILKEKIHDQLPPMPLGGLMLFNSKKLRELKVSSVYNELLPRYKGLDKYWCEEAFLGSALYHVTGRTDTIGRVADKYLQLSHRTPESREGIFLFLGRKPWDPEFSKLKKPFMVEYWGWRHAIDIYTSYPTFDLFLDYDPYLPFIPQYDFPFFLHEVSNR